MRIPLRIAWTASIVSIVLATLPALFNWPGLDLSAILRLYDPIIAILTATLIAVIWYSYFTFKSVRQVEETQATENRRNLRQLVSSLITIRAQILGLKAQLDFWHKPNDPQPVKGFEILYVESEIKTLATQIINLNHLAVQAPKSSQANIDLALVNLRAVRAGLQPLLKVLRTVPKEKLKASGVSQQVNSTISGFDLSIEYFKSAIDSLASEDQPLGEEAAEYFRAFGSAVRQASDPPKTPSS